jgi:serpin B
MQNKLIWLIGASVALAGCGGSNENSNYLPMTRKNVTPEAVDRATKSLTLGKGAKVIQGATDLGFRMFREIVGEKPSSNSFISPLSISMALGMTYNGAGGGTKEAFDKVLGLENLLITEVNPAMRDLQTTLVGADKKVTVNIANSIWTDRKFEPKREFLSANTDYFAAKVQSLDIQSPEAVKAINDWVKQETEEKIPKLFDELSPGTVCVLVNAIYFNGLWTTPFKKEDTKDLAFTGFDSKESKTPMMSRSAHDFDYQKSDKFTAVRLPYGDARLSMVVLLPDQKVGLSPIIKELNAKNWAAWMAKFKPMEGSVTIPKWKVEGTFELKKALTDLGLGVAFEEGKADFTKLASVKVGELFISRVIHKTMVDVSEEGTEAAAATGVDVALKSMAPEMFEFIANRPFLYAIVDKQTNLTLFFGVFGKP